MKYHRSATCRVIGEFRRIPEGEQGERDFLERFGFNPDEWMICLTEGDRLLFRIMVEPRVPKAAK